MFSKISRKPVIRFRTIWGLVRNSQFRDAMAMLDMADNRTKTTAEYLHARAQCLAGLEQYEDAVSCLLGIRKPSILNKRCLAFCYRNMNEHNQALKVLYSIPRPCRDNGVLYEMALGYQEMGRYQTAIDIYSSMDNWRNDGCVLARITFCGQKLETNKPAMTHENLRVNANPSTLFYHYDADLQKGISACAFEKAEFMHNESMRPISDDIFHDLRRRYRNLPHMEALDLAESSSVAPNMS